MQLDTERKLGREKEGESGGPHMASFRPPPPALLATSPAISLFLSPLSPL